MKRTTKPQRSSAPDPTVMAAIEKLYPLINEYLNREAAASHLRAQIAARELDLRGRELDLRGRELDLRFKEHELRVAEVEQDHAERRARLAERAAALAKDTND